MDKNAKIYVAGHRGLVGGAILRRLEAQGYSNTVVRDSRALDLREQGAVQAFFDRERPDYVFLAAAKVGGILANQTYPVEFIRDNLLIQAHVIDAAYKAGTRKLLFLGSSCIYPKFAPQPIREDSLLSGELESTNEWYAVAKIAGIKLCQAYRRQYGLNAICLMPTNLYGPGDNFDLATSHVLPALIRKFHQAKQERSPSVSVWGTGRPLREFLHVDDLADACLFLMQRYDGEDIVNIGCGDDLTIEDLARLVGKVVGYEGRIEWDLSKPDGTPRKLLDISRITGLGWRPHISLEEGVAMTYQWFLEHYPNG